MPGQIACVVTKAALDALTITLSAELAGHRITVNAIEPGPTDTGWISDQVRAEILRASPGGRISSPDDIARIVCLSGVALASSEDECTGSTHGASPRSFSRCPCGTGLEDPSRGSTLPTG